MTMREVTSEQVSSALAERAASELQNGTGIHGWRFDQSMVWHTDAEARDIVRICLALGRPVSDVLTSGLFAALVDEVAELGRAVRGVKS